ncbi:helix-turn-helix domain-containing protein [Megasphaera coli]|uniref:helix-turn-helix domain-containing protein n=1 Tax=Colibacter massiliensis TaxID=1852379 RepID=UPI00094EF953|nr:helix-turn-helix domain-containing protein [Colibacter massiliensis]
MPSAGEVLQTEREVQGRTLTDIAAATHIKTDYLAALEADKYDTIPGAVFVKGFIRSYANYLGINGEELIELYLQHTAPERPQPVRRKVRKSSFLRRTQNNRRNQGRWVEVGIVGMVICLAAVVVWQVL